MSINFPALDEARAKGARLALEAKALMDDPALKSGDPGHKQRLDNVTAGLKAANDEVEQLEMLQKMAGAASPGSREGNGIDGIAITSDSRELFGHPLSPGDAAAVDRVQKALNERDNVRVDLKAALTSSTLGGRRAWAENAPSGPRLLHVAARMPQEGVDAVTAQVPNFTLPTAQAGVAEGASLAEFAASTAGGVSIARFGRFTDFSGESLIGARANSVIALQTIGVARDLDTVLINAVETAAGAAVAFTADVPAAIRKAIAQVIDNTAAGTADELVVLVHPDNAALLQDVAPIGGETIAEGFQRFSGALVYPSSAVDTGFITVANLRSGAVFLQARGLQTVTETNVKTDVFTAATSIIGGYGLTLNGGTSGAFIKVDVVTP
ncbi:MAG: hypothetical protein H5T80_07735 [Dietzia sp.]|nr:hypothetical protein [Dietzia sp.]